MDTDEPQISWMQTDHKAEQQKAEVLMPKSRSQAVVSQGAVVHKQELRCCYVSETSSRD